MRVNPCPVCGRQPKIIECVSKTNRRRRMCLCPRHDGVLPNYHSFFVYVGDGDNNDIYRLWNDAITHCEKERKEGKCSYERTCPPEWKGNPHIEKY